MGWEGEAISAYPLVNEWEFTITESGITGTRTYLENKGQLPSSTATSTLPKIGDSWDTDYSEVTVKTIKSRYWEDNECNGRKFTVFYDGSPSTQSALVSSDDLPINVDVGGELIAVEPWSEDKKGNIVNFLWKWDSDNEDVKQPVFFQSGIANIRFTKVVPDAEGFVRLSMTYVGKVNSGTFFSFPAGQVLYEGCSLFQFKNKMGHNRWKAELKFSVRNVTGDAVLNGWNFILRKDANAGQAHWDRPVNPDGGYLYAEEDFDNLLSSFPLGDDEDYYSAFPSN